MRTITGQAHRERILKSIPKNGKVLEWGSGGSTLWFADRIHKDTLLISVEHDPVWHERVKSKIGERPNVRLLVRPATGPIGENATIAEENPENLAGYIHAVDDEKFDVILVDGVARNACMSQARNLIKPGGTVFLHDAHRDWYDSGKSFFVEHGTMGSCPEYPGPMLWWGGCSSEQPRFSSAALPIVVSFFTAKTAYEEEAAHLRQSLDQLQMEHEIAAVPNFGSWERNCAHKARFIRDTYFRLDRPVLWLDADAVVRHPPLLVAGAEPDFAIHKHAGWQFNSATVYFNRTPLGQKLLETWAQYCDDRPDIWDQIHLDRAWEEVSARESLHTLWLPQSYTKIFDSEWSAEHGREGRPGGEIVIEQFQASRRLKTEVSKSREVTMRMPSEELKAARRAGRPRNCYYDKRFCLLPENPPADPWAIRTEPQALRVAERLKSLAKRLYRA